MKTKTKTALTAALSAVFLLAIGCGDKKDDGDKADAAPAVAAAVKIDLYVMSQCPYGVQAVEAIVPAVEKFSGEVALNLEYVGTVDDADKLHSMHGDAELEGDLYQICAGDQSKDKQLKFVTCVNKEWKTIPKGWESCAKEAGIDPVALSGCVSGDRGKKLLTESFERTKKAGVQGSPNIKINGEEYKGGRMTHDFVKHICGTYGEKEKIKYCLDLPPPAKVTVTAISDKRCGEKCDPAPLFTSLKQVFPGLEPKTLYWEDSETRELCGKLGIKMLPAVFFDESLENDPDGAKQVSRWLAPAGKYNILKVKPEFDPNAEICDNKVDDTGNGKVDCDDPDCEISFACREEIARSLEVFVMSQCPYGSMALKSTKELLDAFGKDMKFTMHFIGEENDGVFQSLHGQPEVEENTRQICAAKHYGANNKYLSYVWCRGSDIRNADWKSCTGGKTGINTAVIEKCATGEEGKALLSEDIKIANGLGIGASPTWIVNGKESFGGIVPADIQKKFCEKNTGLAGCEKKLAGDPDGHAGHGHGAGPGGSPPGLPQGPQGPAPAPSCGGDSPHPKH